MNDNHLKIAVLLGSTRDGRFGLAVANWVMDHLAQRDDMEADLIDLIETPLPTVFPVLGQPPASQEARDLLAAVSPRMAAADAFVIVTPEYNHSFPAALKNAIDWHGTEWHAKPVAFVSYGAFSAGLRAVEHLRLVLAELHAVTIRDSVGLQHPWAQFDGDGKAVDPAADAAAKVMLDRLAWWAHSLREARITRPYAA
ncbi:NADPH-dependent FMN reductase [Streptosporangium roseum]|uniref:Flavoprotein n=1 Tax=Streptosporangium roseum (strain ATCC 12428 / DSM 43021 / JCM 3005 / KCTC 9067 / NCIMB 10171 / NRRL 2505 / NI 9100) TaxID=479432 RepID=D2AW83_STRRD|nr:NAD(P)H-dependent oxidoreductase [Streptosporangium roseum]ACZ85036.1 flavoprotein [Streptosporangium roseum DSM 43021]